MASPRQQVQMPATVPTQEPAQLGMTLCGLFLSCAWRARFMATAAGEISWDLAQANWGGTGTLGRSTRQARRGSLRRD